MLKIGLKIWQKCEEKKFIRYVFIGRSLGMVEKCELSPVCINSSSNVRLDEGRGCWGKPLMIRSYLYNGFGIPTWLLEHNINLEDSG